MKKLLGFIRKNYTKTTVMSSHNAIIDTLLQKKLLQTLNQTFDIYFKMRHKGKFPT